MPFRAIQAEGNWVVLNATSSPAGGTTIHVTSSRPVRLADVMPCFAELDVHVSSFSSQATPVPPGLAAVAGAAAFNASFEVVDGYGLELEDGLRDVLVETMEAALQLRLHQVVRSPLLQMVVSAKLPKVVVAPLLLDLPTVLTAVPPGVPPSSSHPSGASTPVVGPSRGDSVSEALVPAFSLTSCPASCPVSYPASTCSAAHQSQSSVASTLLACTSGCDGLSTTGRDEGHAGEDSQALAPVEDLSETPLPASVNDEAVSEGCEEAVTASDGGSAAVAAVGADGDVDDVAGSAGLSRQSSSSSSSSSDSESSHGSSHGSQQGKGFRAEELVGWMDVLTAQDTIERIMSSPVRYVHKDTRLSEARALMNRHDISALLVDTGPESAPGIITKRDFLKASLLRNPNRGELRVRHIMIQPVISVPQTMAICDCSVLLARLGIRRLLIIDEAWAAGQPAGLAETVAGLAETRHLPLAAFVGVLSDTDIVRCLGVPPLLKQTLSGISLEQSGILDNVDQLLVTAASGWSVGRESSTGSRTGSTGAGGDAAPCSETGSSSSSFAAVEPVVLVLKSEAIAKSTSNLADRYRAAAALWELDSSEIVLIRKIGEGSFGSVTLGDFRGTKVAVKRLHAPTEPGGGGGTGSGNNPGTVGSMAQVFLQLFEREIEILASIRHPNVVTFIGACHTPPAVCLVTEFCARGSLDHLLHKSSVPLDMVKKVEFAVDIARGMSCLHAQQPPVIHRDLKTANLLVSARLEVKVADFGLSRIKDHAMLIASRAGLEGTVAYCAPEVLRGEPYSEKCDLWSYGIVLWEILMRERPHADVNGPMFLMMLSLGNGTLRLAPVSEGAAPEGLRRIVEMCTTFNPAERPTFREVLALLEAEHKNAQHAVHLHLHPVAREGRVSGVATRHAGEDEDSAAAGDAALLRVHPGLSPAHLRSGGVRPSLTPHPTAVRSLTGEIATSGGASGSGGDGGGGGVKKAGAPPSPPRAATAHHAHHGGKPRSPRGGHAPGGAAAAAATATTPPPLSTSPDGGVATPERSTPGEGEPRGRTASRALPAGAGGAPSTQASRRTGRAMMSRARSVPVPDNAWMGAEGEGWGEEDDDAAAACRPIYRHFTAVGIVEEETGSDATSRAASVSAALDVERSFSGVSGVKVLQQQAAVALQSAADLSRLPSGTHSGGTGTTGEGSAAGSPRLEAAHAGAPLSLLKPIRTGSSPFADACSAGVATAAGAAAALLMGDAAAPTAPSAAGAGAGSAAVSGPANPSTATPNSGSGSAPLANAVAPSPYHHISSAAFSPFGNYAAPFSPTRGKSGGGSTHSSSVSPFVTLCFSPFSSASPFLGGKGASPCRVASAGALTGGGSRRAAAAAAAAAAGTGASTAFVSPFAQSSPFSQVSPFAQGSPFSQASPFAQGSPFASKDVSPLNSSSNTFAVAPAGPRASSAGSPADACPAAQVAVQALQTRRDAEAQSYMGGFDEDDGGGSGAVAARPARPVSSSAARVRANARGAGGAQPACEGQSGVEGGGLSCPPADGPAGGQGAHSTAVPPPPLAMAALPCMLSLILEGHGSGSSRDSMASPAVQQQPTPVAP